MDKVIKELKNQKGFSPADAIIGLFIVMVSLTTILLIYENLVVNIKIVQRKTVATRILNNIVENMDMLYYENILDCINDYKLENENKYIINGEHNLKIYNTSIPKGFDVIIEILDSKYDNNFMELNITVNYILNNKEEKVTINKIITRESIEECNKPNFESEYINEIGLDDNEYTFWSKDLGLTSPSVICPLRYNFREKCFYVIDINNNINWYSYSNKEYAMILVLDSNYGIDENGKITDFSIINTDNLYIWIPRFAIGNNDKLYFLYNNTNYSILCNYDGEYIYRYVDIKQKNNILNNDYFKNNDNVQINGKWISYINRLSYNEFNIINSSSYGPMIEYLKEYI